MKKTIAILLALCMLFAFAACGSDGSDGETAQGNTTLTGKWYRVVKGEADENPTLEFNEDGTGVYYKMSEGGRTEIRNFTYTDEAGALSFVYEDGTATAEPQPYTIEGNNLTLGKNTYVKK